MASLSKGHSVQRPSGEKCSSVLKCSNNFQPLPSETVKEAAKRFAAFKSCWGLMHKKLQDANRTSCDSIVDSLIQFVQDSHSDFALAPKGNTGRKKNNKKKKDGGKDEGATLLEDDDMLCSLLHTTPTRREISTAAILAGVNMPDHDVLFDRLRTELRASVTPFVVLLESQRCNAGIKVAMKDLLQQLLNAQEHNFEEEDNEEEEERPAKKKKLPTCTMPLLRSWYGNTAEERGDSPPIVVMFDCLEELSPSVLQEFITVISGSVYCVPFVLVMGVGTTTATIHRSLAQGVSSLLRIKQFSVPSPLVTMDKIVSNVLMSPDVAFVLGPKSCKFLLERFFLSSLSIGDFFKGVNFAVMEHFTWTAASIFCAQQASLSEEMKALATKRVDVLRALPSFRRYVEKQDVEVKLSLLEDTRFTKKTLEQMLCDFYTKKDIFYAFVKILKVILQPLPKSSLGGDKLHQLLLHCVDGRVTESEPFKHDWMYIRVLGEKQLKECFQRVVSTIEDMDSAPQDVRTFKLKIQSYLEQLSKAALAQGGARDADNSDESKMATPVTTSERKQLLEQHLKQAAKKVKTGSSFTVLRQEIMDYLQDVFQEALTPLQDYPCHEVFCFDQDDWLKQHLDPPLRGVIQESLAHPHVYMKSCDPVAPHKPLGRLLPDLSIVYHLHLECGRMINLCDWMQAFISVVSPEEAGKEDSTQVDEQLHDRFMRSVAELQFLGFVKQTRRKRDHVQRLTWGAV